MENITIKEFSKLEYFGQEVLKHLEQREAENNLLIGLISTLKENKHQYSYIDPILIGIYKDNALSSVSLMTPPYNLIVTRASKEELEFLANYIFNKKIEIPGVIGPNEQAEIFAKLYTDRSSQSWELEMNERIYQIDSIQLNSFPEGKMRIATIDDFDTLEEWLTEFYIESDIEIHNSERSAARFKKKIENDEIAIWEDGEIKSMAGVSGKTPNGIRVGYVYTPPKSRNNGYGSAVTASLTKLSLDNGNKFCFLFTDLSNPTSNSIYKKIGYQEVCDAKMIKFI